MAEKEERILVLKATEDDFIYKHFNGKGFIPRAETIERMAKALVSYEKKNNHNGCDWEDYKESVKDIYRARAEAALDALLSSGESND